MDSVANSVAYVTRRVCIKGIWTIAESMRDRVNRPKIIFRLHLIDLRNFPFDMLDFSCTYLFSSDSKLRSLVRRTFAVVIISHWQYL